MSRPIPLVLVLVAVALPDGSAAAQNHGVLGSRLVHRYLTDLRRHDVADLRTFLSPAFQVQRGDGLRQTRSELLRNPPKLGEYAIRRMRVTLGGNVLVATFEVATVEVINRQRFHTSYAARLAVFTLLSKGWQLIAYANFNRPA